MVGFAQARRMMVDGQVRTSDVTDYRIIAAMLELPRERFVPADKAALAYLDLDLPVAEREGTRRFLLRPMVLAKLVQAAEIEPTDQILDVGCATGYSAALLARLGRQVVALEEDADLSAQTSKNLAEIGVENVTAVSGLLKDGWPRMAPYDVIFLDGGTENPPLTLFSQLKPGGRLVCVEGRGPIAKAMLYYSVSGDVSGRPIFDANAPILPGFSATPAFVF